MTIMEIISGHGINGAITHGLWLIEELVQRRHRVLLVCPPGSWVEQEVARRLPEVPIVPSDLHRWPFDELRRISEIVRDESVDVVHTHMSRANFFGILLRWFGGTASVATAHSNHFQLHWMFNDLVIANSEATRRYQHRHNFVRSSRIETIRTFIDRRQMVQAPAGCRERTRERLGLDPSQPLLGIVGNVRPRKGVEYAVRAMPEILAAAPNTRLAIVGSQKLSGHVDRLKSVAQQLGVAPQILWLGQCADVCEILQALDVYVQPSLEEPLGLSILEAMAFGLPVVASRVGGIPEVVVPGHTGLLVPPADPGALADAIVAMVNDPVGRQQFGQAGRQRVHEEFSPDHLVPRIEAAFARAVRARRAA